MQQELFENTLVRSRSTDPSTSHEAAKRVSEFSAQMYKRIMNALEQGEGTYEELSVRMDARLDQLSKRLPEMERLGLIEPTGRTKAGSSGRQQRIWRKA